MSGYYSNKILNHDDPDVATGRTIYMAVLAPRRGFRDDQLGIDDPDIWLEIFKEMGRTARNILI